MHGVVWGQRPWANHSRGLKREAPIWGGYPALSVTARLHKQNIALHIWDRRLLAAL
jgi:hypothetical protein